MTLFSNFHPAPTQPLPLELPYTSANWGWTPCLPGGTTMGMLVVAVPVNKSARTEPPTEPIGMSISLSAAKAKEGIESALGTGDWGGLELIHWA